MNRPVQVRLDLTDNFTGRMGALKDAADRMHFTFERNAATWEPHDWSEWD